MNTSNTGPERPALTLRAVYRRYLPAVRGQASRILRHGRWIDDVVQAAFLTYWQTRNAPAASGAEHDALAQLYRITTALALRTLRGQKPRRATESPAATEAAAPYEAAPSPQVMQLLRVAQPADAEVAALYYLAEMSRDEIAATLEITQQAVAEILERLAGAAVPSVREPHAT